MTARRPNGKPQKACPRPHITKKVPDTFSHHTLHSLYKLAQDNKLPGQKIGRRWRFHKEAVDRWVQSGDLQGDSEAAAKEE